MMSSMYLSVWKGWLGRGDMCLRQKSAMNRLAYDGATGVPIAVPVSCK